MLTQETDKMFLKSDWTPAKKFRLLTKQLSTLKLGQENTEGRWSSRGLPRLKTAEKTKIGKILKNKLNKAH